MKHTSPDIMKRLGILILFLAIAPMLNAQEELEKEVQVVKPYDPSVSDAFKINYLPVIIDTIKYIPTFQYALQPKPVPVKYDIIPIRAAKMVGEPLTKLYGNYLKVGVGSKTLPLIEYYHNNLRNDLYSYGGYFKQHSSFAKVKLNDDSKSFAGFNHTHAGVYGKRFFKNSILDLNLSGGGDTYYAYGYDTDIDTSMNKDDIRKNYTHIDVQAEYYSNYTDSVHVNYEAGLYYSYFEDGLDNHENSFAFKGNLNRYFDSDMVGMDFGFTHIDGSGILDSLDNTIIKLNPWIGKFGKTWRVKAGISAYGNIMGDKSETYYYPHGRLEYDIVDHYFIPYAGVDGKMEVNSYRNNVGFNPYILQGTRGPNTDHKLILYAGLKGNLSSSTFYNFQAKYAIIEHMPFAVNAYASTDSAANQFVFLYDEVELKHYFGELSHSVSEDFVIHAKGNWYSYKMKDLQEAFHRPQYDLSLMLRYDLRDKIVMRADAFLLGNQFYPKADGTIGELDPFIDLNLLIEYRYSKILSAFVHLNNILGTNNYRWNNYPQYGFHFTFGVSYAF